MSSDHDLEQIEIDLLLAGIARRYGYDFRGYARASLRRRILRAVEREQVASISALQERVLHDAACMSRLVTHISVHVTAMFRDPEFHRCLRELVIPHLRTYPYIRIWHAGCATGEEVYSLAIVLEEEGIYDRSRLYATDISDTLLEQAARGIFPLQAMRANTKNYHQAGGERDFSSYYTAGKASAIFRGSLRRNMVFSNHNLVSDGPFNEFNLILCRNVMIYFDPSLRARVHGLLYESLARFGVLGIGAKENLDGIEQRKNYKQLAAGHRLYRRER